MDGIPLSLDRAKQTVKEFSELTTLEDQLKSLLNHSVTLQLNIGYDCEYASFKEHIVLDGSDEEVWNLEEELASITLKEINYLRSTGGVVALLDFIGIHAEGV